MHRMLSIVNDCCCCLVVKSSLTLQPRGLHCSLPGSSVHGISQARILEWVAVSFSRGSSSVIELRSPALQADFLPSELPGKPVITFKTQLNNSEDS